MYRSAYYLVLSERRGENAARNPGRERRVARRCFVASYLDTAAVICCADTAVYVLFFFRVWYRFTLPCCQWSRNTACACASALRVLLYWSTKRVICADFRRCAHAPYLENGERALLWSRATSCCISSVNFGSHAVAAAAAVWSGGVYMLRISKPVQGILSTFYFLLFTFFYARDIIVCETLQVYVRVFWPFFCPRQVCQ